MDSYGVIRRLPNIPGQSNHHGQKRIMSEFILNEKGINTAEVMERLLGQQLRDIIDEKYYIDLKKPIFRYTKVLVV